MKSFDWDTIIAGIGLISLLVGIYLWLGIAAVLILFGIVMIYIGARIELSAKVKSNEPDKTTDTTVY